MTNTLKFFDLVQLAEASYADFTNSNMEQALLDSKFSANQAAEFAKHWRAVDHIPDTWSGFSGTLFQRIDADSVSGYQANAYVFAIRGSTPDNLGIDFRADLGDIFIDGVAYEQVVDLYNYWQRLNTPNGQTYTAAVLVPVDNTQVDQYPQSKIIFDRVNNTYNTIAFVNSNTLIDASLRTGTGALSTTPSALEITGHSLGGHLAMAFTRLFPGIASESLSVNGLGFNANADVNDLFAMLGGSADFVSSNIENVYGLAGPEVAAQNTMLLSQPGGYNGIYIESGGLSTWGGHSAIQMTDSLAVANLFIRLDASFASQTPAQALSTVNALFEKSSNQASQSLEKLVESLSELLLGNKPIIATGDRNSLYTAINNLTDSSTFTSLLGKVTLVAPPNGASEARTDFGAFLSLIYLTPFALKTTDTAAESALGAAQGTLYDQWNDDGALAPEQIANGEANFSDMYLNDRAAMLSWKLKFDSGAKDYNDVLQDYLIGGGGATGAANALANTYRDKLYSEDWDSTTIQGDWDFIDHTITVDGASLKLTIDGVDLTTTTNHQIVFGDKDANTLDGDDISDHLYGMGGADTLNGGKGNDWLEGGADADTLNGGEGVDTLNGGIGEDTYLHAKGDGNDVIVDSDGLGSIKLNGQSALSGGEQVKNTDNLWQSTDKQTLYSIYKNGDGTNTLNIYSGSERLFVKNWVDGDLGINLPEAKPDPTPAPPETSDHDYVTVTGGSKDGLSGNDVMVGGDGKEYLIGNIGNDILFGNAGDDTLEGGDGNDYLDGGIGHNVINGGAGNDIIVSGSYYDNISIHEKSPEGIWQTVGNTSEHWQAQAGSWTWELSADSQGQHLYYYDDVLGSQWKVSADDPKFGFTFSSDTETANPAPRNILFGGAGNDVISGASGDDYISGDEDDDTIEGREGEDNLFGGTGNDEITGGDDNDYIDGGENNDQLYGGYEADLLLGGDGDDALYGDLPQLIGTDAPPSSTNYARMGDDSLDGGAGNDKLWGGGGADLLMGGADNDELSGDGLGTPSAYMGNDMIDGGAGDDKLWGDGKDDTLLGGTGNDELYGDASNIDMADHGKDTLDGGEGDDKLVGGGGDDMLIGGAGKDMLFGDGDDIPGGNQGNDYLDGGDGDDQLQGYGGDDELHGGAGEDTLYGMEGKDVLEGGAGTDQMDGGAGDDTYILNAGDSPTGADGSNEGIHDTEGRNTLQFNGISADSIVVGITQDEQFLVLDYTGADRLVLRLDNADSYTYEFSGGERLSLAQLVGRLNPDIMTGNDDTGHNYQMGGYNDDNIVSTGGNATLSGGQGMDTLTASGGGNIYRYGIGDNTDTIVDTSKQDGFSTPNTLVFGPDITQDQISLGIGSLMIRVGDNPDDVIHIEGLNPDDPLNPDNIVINRFVFDDGTELTYEQLLQKGFDLIGSESDDFINGTALTDRIDGGEGNDTLEGGMGDDTYIYRANGSSDNVFDVGGTDTIKLVDHLPADLVIEKNYRDITLKFPDGGSLTLMGVMVPEGTFTEQAIERLEFADGTSWDLQALVDAATFVPPPGQEYYGEEYDETIIAGEGDDTVYAGYGHDEVYGGLGNDILYGTDSYDRNPQTEEGGNGIAPDDDILYGEAGDDTLDGGFRADHDTLIGGTGNDTYILRHGAGSDTVIEEDGESDRIFIEATPDQLHITRNATDLILKLNGDLGNGAAPAMLTVQGFYTDGNARIETIEFNDGTIWESAAIIELANTATAGDDWLEGTTVNDTLQGLAGNDHLSGGEGDDTYVFATGDGADTITDNAGSNVLQLQGITADNLRTVRMNDDLIVLAGNNRDRITVANWFADPATRMSANLDDGTILTADELEARVNNNPTGGDDFLPGTVGNDVLLGLDGSDILLGMEGDDTLDGGVGDDELQGGLGNDTYVYYSGEGADAVIDTGGWDTLKLADLLPGDVQLMAEGADLIVSLNDGTELRMVGVRANPDNTVEAIEFADGTLWGENEIAAYTFQKPTTGGDTVYGTERDDRIDGLGGGDFVSGGAGDDSYYFGRDYQYLGISDGGVSSGDVLVFKDGIILDDLLVTRSFSDLRVAVQGGNGYDQIYINNYFYGSRIESFVFADGTTLSYQDLDRLIAPPPATTEGVDGIYGTGRDEVIDGLGGSDYLDGYGGNDTLNGGAGIDRIFGGEGDDTLTGGISSVSDVQQESNWDSVGTYYYYLNAQTDYLDGGAGNDTYLINKGDGYDQIVDQSGDDRIVLGTGLSAENIVVKVDSFFHPGTFRIDYGVGAVHVQGSYLSSPIERIESADGQVVLGSELGNYVVSTVSGTATGDILVGGLGPQIFNAGGGGDVVHAGAGRDTVNGGAGDDVLYGDSGDDTLNDTEGYNYLSGGIGSDSITGLGLLEGGSGNDTLTPVSGSTVLFGRGDGADTITSGSTGYIVQLKQGIAPMDLVVTGKLLDGIGGRITVSLLNGTETLSGLEGAAEIRFADGTVWTQNELRARSVIASATEGNDTLIGSDADDVLNAGAGDDVAAGGTGNDLLIGGAGNDRLYGNEGDDILDAGSDSLYVESLYGGAGRDTYRFGHGYGTDIVSDRDLETSSQTETVIEMAPDVIPNDVTVTRSYMDLVLDLGNGDRLAVSNWLNKPEGSGPLIVRFADGTEWRDADLPAMLSLQATEGADSLRGTFVADNINAGGGNDTVEGAGGDDALDGGAGGDTLSGGAGNDTLDGGIGDDTLLGGEGDDVYQFGFGSGHDRILNDGFNKGDIIRLGTGVSPSDVSITLSGRDLVVTLFGGNDALTVQDWQTSSNRVSRLRFDNGLELNLLERPEGPLMATEGSDYISATEAPPYDDYMYGLAGNDYLEGGNGNDHISGGADNDILVGGYGQDVLDGGTGNDIYRLSSDDRAQDEIIFGFDSGQDLIQQSYSPYGASAPKIVRFESNVLPSDVKISALWISPQAGTSGNPVEKFAGTLAIDLNGSTAKLSGLLIEQDTTTGAATVPTTFVFADGTVWSGVEILSHLPALSATTADDSLVGGADADSLAGLVGSDVLVGGDGNDTLNGGAGADVLFGGTGDDVLVGGSEADTLLGGVGNDVLEGNAGDDRLSGGIGSNIYRFGGNWGADTVYLNGSAREIVEFDITVSQYALQLTYSGSQLVLSVPGTTNKVTLTGTPNEIRFADGTIWNASDVIERTKLATSGADTLSGSAMTDHIDGQAGNDIISGGAGNDWLLGNSGDDSLTGEAGNDRLDGGIGNDILNGGLGGDTYVFGLGYGQDVILDAGDGVDTVEMDGIAWTDVTLTRTADAVVLSVNGTTDQLTIYTNADGALGVERIRFTDGTVINPLDGSVRNSVLEMLQGSGMTVIDGDIHDTLTFPDGVMPADVVVSHNGDDLILMVGTDGITFRNWYGDMGTRGILQVSFADDTLWSAMELSRRGSEVSGTELAETLTGLKLHSNVLYGRDGNDRLLGGNAADTLEGGAGDDTLEGGFGDDAMSGGIGNDIYYIDSLSDVITEVVDEGNDTVRSAITYTLGEHLENLELLGGAAINGTGNAGDNHLIGNVAVNTLTAGAGDDMLDGGAGADTMIGGVGDDSYYIDNLADSVVENSGEGLDTVNSAITYTLSANLENLTLTGTAAINGTGNANDNHLIGNVAANTLSGGAGNDVLDGGAGKDTLVGGTGDDTYYVDTVSDVVTESANAGTDTVIATATYSIASYVNVENLTLEGETAINGTGNSTTNLLKGNVASNILSGGAGDDTLDGGAGNDLLRGDQGSDTYVFDTGSGQDTIVEIAGPAGAVDKILMAAGVTAADILLRWNGNDLVISRRDSADRITVQGFKLAGGEIEEIGFSDGTTMTYAQIVSTANAMPVAEAPVVSIPLTDNAAFVGQTFELILNQNAFTDTDVDDMLAYSATQSDGTALPSWLKFDASTRRFYGQPAASDIGLYSIKVVVSDSGNLSVSDIFTLNVGHAHDTSPIVLNPAEDISAAQHQPVDFMLPQDMFFDADPDDVLILSAHMADGQALPSWLIFDALTQRFSGIPPTEATGDLTIAVSATDSRGRVATDAFVLSIADTNDAPRVLRLLPDQILNQGDTVGIQLPSNMFVDPEGDLLVIGVTQPNGDPLPDWLSYDAATGLISGQAASDAVGVTSIRVTATDTSGLGVSETFDIAVADANDAPIVANPLVDMVAIEEQSFRYVVPGSVFSDPDRGDVLSYSMQMVSAPVHAKAHFDFNVTTREISGNKLGYWDIGTWTFKVTATDRLGMQTEDTFDITVNPADINHAPIIAYTTTPWNELQQSRSVSRIVPPANEIVVPVNLTTPEENAAGYNGWQFIDLDSGDVLNYSVTPISSGITDWHFDTETGLLHYNYNGNERATNWQVTATDMGGLSVGYNLNVTVNGSPVAPALADIVIYEDQLTTFTLPANAFIDPDGDVLQLSGTMILEQSTSGLQPWATFSSQTQTYSFTPHDFAVGTYNLTITAKDPYRSIDSTFGSTSGPIVGETSTTIKVTVLNTYDAPRLTSNLITDRIVTENQSVSISTGGAFQEVDSGEKLTYSAMLSNGAALPSWISINPTTGVLSGIPKTADVGMATITVTATDRFGAVVSDTFDLAVNLAPGNHVPILAAPLADQIYRQGQVFNFQLPADAFYDVDAGDSLTYSATLENGQALPSWLQFNASARTFSGMVPAGQLVPTQILVTARDKQSATTSDVFAIAVDLTNQSPIVASPLVAQITLEDQLYSYTIPTGTFVDPDSSSALIYSASLADGSELPSWLTFNAETATFSGQPGNNEVGVIQMRVTATDSQGESMADYFQMTVQNVNDAPIAVGTVPVQLATEDSTFSFVLPETAFADMDAGDVLTYSVTLSDGSPLPDWLGFDTTTRTFTGAPSNADVGVHSVNVLATDLAGSSALQTFSFEVANVNDAPLAEADTFVMDEDMALILEPASLLANDSDFDPTVDVLAITSVGNAVSGAVLIDDNGAIRFTPVTDYNGLASFDYTVADGNGGYATTTVSLRINPVNDVPYTTNPLADMAAVEDQMFSVSLAANTFGDVDIGDSLSYAATLADGSALPDWLVFDAATMTFSGTPVNSDVGQTEVTITATDTAGSSVSDTFGLRVANTNDAPIVTQPLSDVMAVEDTPFVYALPADAFADIDAGDTLTYAATLDDGSALPTWLIFDAENGRFSGTPANDDVGNLSVAVTATDQAGASVTSAFNMSIANVNDAPQASKSVADQVATEDVSYSYIIPADTFADVDVGDILTYTATLANGSATPSWLTFNSATGTFSGIPTNADVGALLVTVAATDQAGASASQTFRLDIINSNDAPVASAPIANQLATEDVPFTWNLPTDAFADIDADDTLTYAAMLADGSALPAWLVFDTVTGVFSGTPTNGDVGNLSIMIKATDVAGAEAKQTFDLMVANVNDAPVTFADSGNVAEDGVLKASGNVLMNDIDIDAGDLLSVANAGSYQGIYGNFTLNVDGSYSYILDNAIAQSLGENETATERLAYKVTDGTVLVEGELVVTVSGQNDAPVFAAALDPVAATVGSMLAWTLPANVFTDADANDALSYGIVQENGSNLPSWLSFNAATRTLTGTPSTTDTGQLRLTLVAMDGSGAQTGGLLEIDIAAPQGHGKVIVGTPEQDMLVGTAYDDVIDGQGSFDTLVGGNGNDLYIIDDNGISSNNDSDYCGDGSHDNHESHHDYPPDQVIETAGGGYDTVWSSVDYTLTDNVESLLLQGTRSLRGTGNGANNLLIGNLGNSSLDGRAGNDILLGGSGNDHLNGGDGLDALDGGYGDDRLEDGAGAGFVAGSRGNDAILLAGGNDIVAFNRGDGKDTVSGGDGQNDTLSLGGGIRLADLKLNKDGKDLVLNTGGGDSIRMVDWYASGNHKMVATLQIAHAEDSTQFDRYNFAALAAAFDKARKSGNTARNWTVSEAAPSYRLAGAQPDGGELAMAFAESGNLEHLHPDIVSTALAVESAAAPSTSNDGADVPDLGSPLAGGTSGMSSQDNGPQSNGPDYWSQLDAPVAGEQAWDTMPVMADTAADWLHYAEQNGYNTVSSGDSRIDYAVTWARLHDKLAGLLEEDHGGTHGHWGEAHDGKGSWLGASANFDTHGHSVNLPGNLLRQFEGLKEGVGKLHA
ncbi:MAG: putative Ig domain-containing protein [Methylotenera sp.]